VVLAECAPKFWRLVATVQGGVDPGSVQLVVAVDTPGVDLEQDVDGEPPATFGRRHAESSHVETQA
jgi:hypothetical protein